MYGLIGRKLGHSFSADFFNTKFKREGIQEEYRLLPIESIGEFPELVKQNPDLKGLNVTIPYKEEILPFLDSISREVETIGAANVVKIENGKNGRILKGYNTDCIGFRQSLMPLLRPDVKQAIVLGTGGASKAINYTLKSLGINTLLISRNPSENMLNYKDIDKQLIDESLLVVNTTPLGMYPDNESCPSFPFDLLSTRHICYDLVYNPLETEFMKRSAQKGAKVKNGLEMLERQAEAAWEIWTR